jgi:signal peptidase I
MKKIIVLTLIVFVLGWLSNTAYSQNFTNNASMFTSNELISPSDWINEEDILIQGNYITINFGNREIGLARYANSGSMDPILDIGANGIEIKPNSEEELQVGDIVTFKPFWSNKLIVHRIIQIGNDDEGWYCVTKGDNNILTDPGKLRYGEIESILAVILY